MTFVAIALSLTLTSGVRAQSAATDSAKTPGIQDNSFLIEEAYNQEAGVVQHISALNIDRTNKSYEYDFTQEWPAGGIAHQLSYTIPLVHSAGSMSTGIGDVLLNYRYQLVGDGDAPLAVSPRFSVAFPTGDWKNDAGRGAAGYEGFLPVSIAVSNMLVTHLNAGARYTPSARNASGDRADVWKYALGGSEILAISPTFNLMLETLWSREGDVVAPGKTRMSTSWTISPGARMALNYKSGLQIVPGIAFPLGIGPSRGERGVFLYLSFEHPFNDAGRKK
ncbi:MAG: transporter [Gemmatimonadaceae bacterium]|nr:transporter [Gemmatimonadaceae bacterium]